MHGVHDVQHDVHDSKFSNVVCRGTNGGVMNFFLGTLSSSRAFLYSSMCIGPPYDVNHALGGAGSIGFLKPK